MLWQDWCHEDADDNKSKSDSERDSESESERDSESQNERHFQSIACSMHL